MTKPKHTERRDPTVGPLPPERRGEALQLVERLLDELGEERADCPHIDRERVLREWTERGELSRAFVAELDGELVGTLTVTETFALYANGRYGTLDEMYVAPAHRSGGVGARLLRAAVEHGRERAWSRLDVTAPEAERWARSRRFYERQGFTFAGPKLKLPLPGGDPG